MFFCVWASLATAATPLTLDRTLEKAERDPPAEPDYSASTAAQKVWTDGFHHRRDLQAVDASLRWTLADLAACAGDRPAGASAALRLSVSRDGRVGKLTPGAGADPELVRCARARWEDQLLPVLLHQSLNGAYTLRESDAVAVPSGGGSPSAGSPAPVPPSASAPAPVPPSASSPAPAPDRDAFALLVDAEPGFVPFAWGASTDGIDGLTPADSTDGTTFYHRDSDAEGRLFGLPAGAVTYGFDAAGFYIAAVSLGGNTVDWKLREILAARYGEPRWDVKFGCYYWRGAHVLVESRPVPNTDVVVLTFLDIAHARASHLADRLPGDRDDPSAPSNNRRMPRIYKDDPPPVPVNAPGPGNAPVNAPTP